MDDGVLVGAAGSLLSLFYWSPPNKKKPKLGLHNNNPPQAIIMIGQSEIGNSSQIIILITLFSKAPIERAIN